MSGSGGTVIWWFLLGLSVVAMAVLFEGLIAIRRSRIVPTATALAIEAAVKSHAYGDTLESLKIPAHDSLLAGVVVAGIRLARDDPSMPADEIRSNCREEGQGLACRLYRRIEVLGTLGMSHRSSGCWEPHSHSRHHSAAWLRPETRREPPTSPPRRAWH